MTAFFKELFEYSHHFNLKLIEAFDEYAEDLPERSVELLNHMFNAHNVWNYRINAGPIPYGLWDIHSPNQYKKIEEENYTASITILNKFKLETRIEYKNTKGQVFTNSARDILFQVINHTTYHRGQIAINFRENGLEPLLTDYIFYKR